jgi:hypothetical protein
VTSRENINKASLEPSRRQELVQNSAAFSLGLGKVADELAKELGLRPLLERPCDKLRKGSRPMPSITERLTAFQIAMKNQVRKMDGQRERESSEAHG